jgi:hypothetical protein
MATILNGPDLYSLKTGSLISSLGGSVYELSSYNLNSSLTRFAYKPGFDSPFSEYYVLSDLLKNERRFIGRARKREEFVQFACANNEKKIAVFNVGLLLPVIITDSLPEDLSEIGIRKYNDIKLDLDQDGGLTRNIPKGALKEEIVVNDSTIFYEPGEQDSNYNHQRVLYRKKAKETDSFQVNFDLVVRPLTGSKEVYWTREKMFYVFDLGRFQLADSFALKEEEDPEEIYPYGNEIIIKRKYKERIGFLAYRYNTVERRITDTAWKYYDAYVFNPCYEKDYTHLVTGFPISDAVCKDIDHPRDITWEYYFISGRVDTVAVLDSNGEISSYVAKEAVSFLRYKKGSDEYAPSIDITEKIGQSTPLQVRYWKDNKYAILVKQGLLLIYNMITDSVERSLPCNVNNWSTKLFILSDGNFLVSNKDKNDSYVIDPSGGRPTQHLTGYYNPDIRQNKYLLILQDASFGNFYIYSLKDKDYLCSVTLFSKSDYVVYTTEGLFDGTEKGMENLYFLVNDPQSSSQPWKTIDLKQLKAKYYIPGLFQKLLSGDVADLPDVESIKYVSLAPAITTDSSWSLNKPFHITVENKGGGIGAVRIVINGKEVLSDARSLMKADGNKFNISVDLKPFQRFLNPERNSIQVFCTNSDSSLSSRGVVVTSSGTANEKGNPKLYVISIGTSDYKGQDIDLQYSSKDAVDMSTALRIGGSKLFGADSTVIYTVSSLSTDSTYLPSKKNIERIFNEVSGKAGSKDIILIYLSGHGISVGNDFYYLTKDAWSANASTYIYRELLTAVSISSSEFTEYLKKIPALKQLFIIDACASGKVVENLMAHRDIPVSTLKALDRMKDRTGTHVITGCAADAVSYEASRFGQGLLTYSLLEGMKGASLRENKFLDVSQWFQYARDRVPQLATGLGGIQTPQVCSPQNNESFDIALLEDPEKKMVPLATERPVFIKSIFQEKEQFADIAGIAKAVDISLTEPTKKGTAPGYLYIPVDDFPGSFQVLGRYKINNGIITASIKVIETSSHKIVKSFTVTSASARSIADTIAEKINDLQ